MRKKLVIGTRGSKLALWQANHIADCLRKQYPDLDVILKHITTTGDKILDVPLAKIGGKGLFTKELEAEMLEGTIDLAVHSLKDMPTELPEGLTLAAITKRVDPGDALISPVYKTLENLPQGAKVGTSSLRRKAQLLSARPDLQICELRGNVDTRLKKLDTGDLDAIVLAAAGLKRLGWQAHITEILAKEICLPAVGQGALAIEARQHDAEVLEQLEFLNDRATRYAVTAERAFLKTVEGGCQVPVGVFGRLDETKLTVEAIIATIDGQTVIKDCITGDKEAAALLGKQLANRMLDAGGRKIMVDLGCMV
ncbi:hydroxymethylbilane synthase [Anaerosinus massiliensis]|uniref:hydroxymethylbilane synthase n=1 Tax=Massilibacillus massiliensis TaxID=1806837 RepID=UPI000B24892C|nr:hydroxymethylbilane synthase [Massilibacillus massiliensis]